MKKMILSLLMVVMMVGVGNSAEIKFEFFDGTRCVEAQFLDHVGVNIQLVVTDEDLLNPLIRKIRGIEAYMVLTSPQTDIFNTSISVTYPIAASDYGLWDQPRGTYEYDARYVENIPPSHLVFNEINLATLDVFFLDASSQSPPFGNYQININVLNFKLRFEDERLINIPLDALGERVLQINSPECMVVDNDNISFGTVKSLYR